MTKLNVDCLFLIFNELLEDSNSLYSCLLVNKEWCNVVAPILWGIYSWGNRSELEKKVYNIILSCLPSPSKQLLFNNNIELPSTILLKPPLFNYISFCPYPSTSIINEIIGMVELNNDNKRNFLEQEIYKLFVSQCKDIKYLCLVISQSLFIIFRGINVLFFNSKIYILNSNL